MINHFKGRVQIPLREIIRQRRMQVRDQVDCRIQASCVGSRAKAALWMCCMLCKHSSELSLRGCQHDQAELLLCSMPFSTPSEMKTE